MAGWLDLAISKDFGGKSKSPEDGWEVAGWLALAMSTDFGWSFSLPGDGWEMAGWLAPTISKDFGRNYRSRGDGWEMAVAISRKTNVNLDRRGMAGRWLGGCPWLFPRIACVILDPCEMAGR